jgi:hypothetical protein
MRTLIAVSVLWGFAACTDQETLGEETGSVVANNKLAANKLAANKLAANKLAANKLAANKLAANKLAANKLAIEDLITTPDGREVLSYAISCAFDADVTLVAEYMGTTYEFFGEVGVAPRWADHPLDRAGRGWISACLFARVNAHDVAIPVSLRGPNKALTATADEKTGWPLQEGAFYGDYFTPGTDPPDWYACRGDDQAAGETGGLIDRDCAEPDPAHPGKTLCGFNYAGDCMGLAQRACEGFSQKGTFYERCHDQAITRHHHFDDEDGDDDDDDHDGHHHGGCGHSHHGHKFHQVITTYTTP